MLTLYAREEPYNKLVQLCAGVMQGGMGGRSHMNWKRLRKPMAIIAALALVVGLFPAYAVADSVGVDGGGAGAANVANDKGDVNGNVTEPDSGKKAPAGKEQTPTVGEKAPTAGEKTPAANEAPMATGAAKAAPTHTVTVTFDAKGGEPVPDAQTFESGGKATRPSTDPSKNGWAFGGWFIDDTLYFGAPELPEFYFDTPVTEDLVLYAGWAKYMFAEPYDLTSKTYDVGGSIAVNGSEPYPKSVLMRPFEGMEVSLSATPTDGYEFVGWSWSRSEDHIISGAGMEYSFEITNNSPVGLYALFREKPVTVTFNLNGGTIDGSADPVKQVIEKGGKATEPDNAVKEGFEEPDWFKDGIGDEIDLGNATFVEDTELVARWRGRIKAWVYGVTEGERYKGGKIWATGYDSSISEASLPIYEGGSMTLTAVPKDGYRFSGWAESEDGEVIKPEVDFVIESYDGSVTRLVALFVKVADITYDVNGGTKGADWKDGEIVDVGTNLSKVLGDTVPDSVPENVAKAPEGKAFCGYRIKTDADEQDLLSGKPINVEITGATTVTYLWRDPTVTIHWSSMDDVDKMDPIVIEGVPVGSTVAEALAKIGGADRVDELFAKDGYKALGWLTSEPITKFSDYDALGGAEVKGSAVVEGDMDLYYGMLTEIDGTAEATIEVPVCGTEVTTPGGDRNKQTNAPQISTPDGVNYSPDTAKGYLPAWWMVSAAEPYTPFEGTIKGGQAYYAGIWLAADYGYVFASDNIAVDGAEVIEPWSELDGRFVGAAVSVEAEHEWGEWTVVKEATEEADGLEQRTCKHCDAAEEKAIPKIDVEYRCVAGDGSSLTFGSGETLSFIFKRNVNDEASFSHFTGISIDGKVVDKSNYTAKPGSVIVTLEPSFAKTLSVGDHTIEAMFNDGNNAAASFTVTAASEEETTPAEEKPADKAASDESKESPKTGDTLPMGAVGLTAIAAAAVLAFAWRKRRA